MFICQIYRDRQINLKLDVYAQTRNNIADLTLIFQDHQVPQRGAGDGGYQPQQVFCHTGHRNEGQIKAQDTQGSSVHYFPHVMEFRIFYRIP